MHAGANVLRNKLIFSENSRGKKGTRISNTFSKLPYPVSTATLFGVMKTLQLMGK